jgi:iron complex outermembrane receptor protein
MQGKATLAAIGVAALLGTTAPSRAAAQDTQAAQNPASPAPAVEALSEVVVSASRHEQRSFDAPASIQSVDAETIRSAGPQVNLSEALSRVPGVVVLNRQNYAQDLQLSIRGFGARSSFGIRGVRLIVDGIPATMPDGQGQAATISLPSTDRIEVLRGPLALLYGNAAGGVVQAFTAEGRIPMAGASWSLGSFGSERWGLNASGRSGSVNMLADWSRFSTDGYREHSAARREQFNAKLGMALSPQTRMTVVANVFDQPLSQDPLGLTREQMQVNRRQVDPSALLQDTRKTVSQNQIGIVLEHRLDADRRMTARVYGGQRAVFQTLATPLAAQSAVTASGGVVDLDRDYGGIGVQYAHTLRLQSMRLTTTVGLDHDRQRELRLGFVNNGGVVGARKRNELNQVQNTDLYALATLSLPDDWTVTAGVRSSRVGFRSDDRFVVAGNGDDSGARTYRATSPVIGVAKALGEHLNVYANIGKGFETPTFAELAYRTTAGNATGLNLALEASRSRQMEVGAKWRTAQGQRLDLALFSIRTNDEIVIDANSGGRTTFKNAGRTLREGAELSWAGRLSDTISARVALTWLAATYRDDFVSGTGAAAVTVPAGNRLAGTADKLFFGEMVWRPALGGPLAGLQLAGEVLQVGRVHVNDANTDSAAPYALLNLRAGLRREFGRWRISPFVRVDNVTARRYEGSVIVNDGNRRFFEPAPGRTWVAGVSVGIAL